jgi:PAS domain-containing protein
MNRNHADEKAIDRGITPDLQKEPQTLREQQVLLDAIIAASPIPKFVLDKNHRVISWNRALENTTRIRAGTVLGTDLHWKAFYA